ncbi:hypothetical protein ADEAN_000345900 [Angomonas deanei]|uniref:Uncharacterized protein n=1 Tax=Angomonas deanei TaxID=59799 RepID=A0A7G2CAA8_9TRYP|nr:hypothetical protein ADEAN_000345900 [Angomonas deanei]
MTFTGTIKDTPADFVVVEVDLHQQRVDTEGYVFYDEHKNNNPNNNINHSNKKEEKQEEKGLSEKEVFLLFQQHYEPILQFFGSSSVVGEKAEELFLSKDKNNVDPFLEYLSRGGFSQNNNNNNNETEKLLGKRIPY